MVRALLKGINTVRARRADGSTAVYYYHRASGERLKGEPGSAEFLVAYAAAERPRADRLAGALAGLIREFILSAEFETGLAESTQREYRRLLTEVEKEFGSVPLPVVEDERFVSDVLVWRDEVAMSRPREADNRVIVFARMLAWGTKRRRVRRNVLEGYERIHKVDRSEKIWLPEHVEAFQREASPDLWPVFLVALHTGLRQGDIRTLPWAAYDGERITTRIAKRRKGETRVKVTIRCTRTLKALLDSLPRRGPLMLTTATGMAWTARYLGRRIDEARARAAAAAHDIAGLHFHDLRGTAILMLAEAGCTEFEIASITGHSYRSIAAIMERYLPRTRHLADMAIAKLENSGRTNQQKALQKGHAVKREGAAK